jgi:hypothetical protein
MLQLLRQFMTQGTLHAQPKLPPTNPHETLETQEAVSGDDFTLHPLANTLQPSTWQFSLLPEVTRTNSIWPS